MGKLKKGVGCRNINYHSGFTLLSSRYMIQERGNQLIAEGPECNFFLVNPIMLDGVGEFPCLPFIICGYSGDQSGD